MRPDIRTYHYPGWDRPWREDIDWLDTYDQPVVLDECSPPFQDNARAPLHADVLAIDPGMRDYWVTGLQPFVARAMRDKGCIGGMIWSAVDDQWPLPNDERIGIGNWAHLTRLDYYRVRDVHAPQDGRYFRGEGEWGLIDGWGRSRPELWHVHKLYSPIEITSAAFDVAGSALELTVRTRPSHRALEPLALRATGATVRCRLVAAPGATAQLTLSVHPGAPTVDIAFVHPEGWDVDSFSWEVPGRTADPHEAVQADAEPVRLTLTQAGDLSLAGVEPWLTSWPRFHVQDTNLPAVAMPLPAVDSSRAAVASDGAITVPLTGNGWDGSLTVRASGAEVVFDYACTYSGDQVIDARETGLAFDMPGNLRDLWWDRAGDWSTYPAGHIGRPRGYATSDPAPANPLKPAGRWERDTSDAGSNDYRSAKRSVYAAGATDGSKAVTVLSDGSQHVRATLVNGAPVLHVLDWYGGVPFRLDTDHIWTTNFGTGKRIARGTSLQGRVTMTCGKLPETAHRSARDLGEAEELSV